MRLENEFTVAAPIEQTWRTLLDIERVATCLPGATIEPGGEEGVFRGAMKVKLGPMTVDYRGTARLQDIDEDTHSASIAVQAREARGQGTAAAVIRNRLEPQNGGTRVVAETDLQVTGRQAQFGRGIMEDVASSMMEQFASRLEHEIRDGAAAGDEATAESAGGPGEPEAEPGEPSAAAAPETDEALDLGAVLAQSSFARYARVGGAAMVILLVLVMLTARRRRQLTINVDLSR